MFAAIWGSPMLIDDKVYLGDEDGDVAVIEHGKTFKLVAESNMGSSVYATPVPANGTLFIMNRNQLYAICRSTSGESHGHGRGKRGASRGSSRSALLALVACLSALRSGNAQNWPSFRGANGRRRRRRRRRRELGHRVDAQRRLEDRHSRAGALEPDRLGRPHLRHDGRGVERHADGQARATSASPASTPPPTWCRTPGT